MRRYGWLLLAALAPLAACADGTGPGDPVTSVTITPAQDTLVALQDTVRLSAVARDGVGAVVAARITWASLDTLVATVDSLGRAVSRGTGTARITARAGSAADTALVVVRAAVSPNELEFLRLAAGSPLPVTLDTSFWAVRGRDVELEIRHRTAAGAGGDEDGEELFEFRVPGDALLRRPDGRVFARGDSVLIHIRMDPTGLFVFDMEPSGLRFDPEHPAEMRVHYQFAAPVRNEDELFLWRQERAGEPWHRIASVRVKDLDEIRAEITGFSAFSLALP